jgi:hypothetical protein
VLLKKYAIFMAQSRVGHIADTISVRTLINYVRLLLTVFGIDRGCRLDKALTDDIQAYVYNDMAKEYQLSREQWKKPVASSEDLSATLKSWQTSYWHRVPVKRRTHVSHDDTASIYLDHFPETNFLRVLL